MNHNTKNAAKRATICGVFSAVCVVLLYIGSVSVFDLSAIVIAALLTMIVKIEVSDKGWPWGYVAVTGGLALVLLPVKLVAVEFLFIGGVYPLMKAVFERLHPILAWVLKIAFFDCLVLSEILISRFVLVSEEARIDLTVPAILVATAFGILFDLALTAAISAYILKIRKKLGLKKLF